VHDSHAPDPIRLCFVCLGNICRSPAAEAVMRRLVEEAGLADAVVADSAGTARYHLGELPDRRTIEEARRRGLVADHRARQLRADELTSWDLLLAMDESNVRDLDRLAGQPIPSSRFGARVRLLRSFDPAASAAGDLEVPDPYYEDEAAFVKVFDLVEAACAGLLTEIEDVGAADVDAPVTSEARQA
jgi:low molecular weight protein-tyrosine phosphatase